MNVILFKNGFPEKSEAMYASIRRDECEGKTQPEIGRAFVEFFERENLKPTGGSNAEDGIPSEIFFRGTWKMEDDEYAAKKEAGTLTDADWRYDHDCFLVFCVPK